MNANSDPSFVVNLNSIEKVKAFVNKVTKFDEDLDLIRDRYVIDAKSIMGIFSLDLTKPIDLVVHTDDMDRFNIIKSTLSDYEVVETEA
ncbi:MAG: HPr family phosphocarrier protein [Bacilli bacterium]|nr:HPr family phosphocarrier protein [Bacilli bacterium]